MDNIDIQITDNGSVVALRQKFSALAHSVTSTSKKVDTLNTALGKISDNGKIRTLERDFNTFSNTIFKSISNFNKFKSAFKFSDAGSITNLKKKIISLGSITNIGTKYINDLGKSITILKNKIEGIIPSILKAIKNLRAFNITTNILNKSINSLHLIQIIDLFKSFENILKKAKADFINLSLGISRVNSNFTRFNNSLNKTKIDLDKVNQSTEKVNRSVFRLSTYLKGLFAYLGVRQVLRFADAWLSVAGAVQVNTENDKEAKVVLEALYNTAQHTRQSLSTISELYNRSAIAAGNLNVSQKDLIKFTKNVGEALAIQHTGAQQARGTMLELGEAMGQNIVRSQQYNALLKNGNVILIEVAKYIGKGIHSVADLGKAVHEGKITSKEFFDAFLKGSKDLDASFAKTKYLFSQGFVILGNGISKYINDINNAVGATDKFGRSVKFITDHLNIFGTAILATGTALTATGGIAVIKKLIPWLFKLASKNIWAAIVVGIITATVVIATMADKMKVGIGATTTFKDVMIATFRLGKDACIKTEHVIKNFFATIQSGIDSLKESEPKIYNFFMYIENVSVTAWKKSINAISNYFKNSYTGFASYVIDIARVNDSINDIIRGVIHVSLLYIEKIIKASYKLLYNWIVDSINNLIKDMNKGLANLISSINLIRKALKEKPFKLELKIPLIKTYAIETAGEFYKDLIDAFKNEMKNHPYEDLVTMDFESARRIAKKRHSPGGTIGTKKKGKGGLTPDEITKNAQLLRQYKDLRGSINPVIQAANKLNRAENFLQMIRNAGVISLGQETSLVISLKKAYDKALHPFDAMMEKLKDQIDLTGFLGDKQKIEMEIQQKVNQLKIKGFTLSAKQMAKLRAFIVLKQKSQKLNKAENSIIQETIGNHKNQMLQVSALIKLYTKKYGVFTKEHNILTENQKDEALTSMFSKKILAGTTISLRVQLKAQKDYYAGTKKLRDAGTISEENASIMIQNIMRTETKIKKAYHDAKFPFEALTNKIKDQMSVYDDLGDKQKVAIEFQKQLTAYEKLHGKMTDKQKKQLRALLQQKQDSNDLNVKENSLLQNTIGKQQQEIATIYALIMAYNDKKKAMKEGQKDQALMQRADTAESLKYSKYAKSGEIQDTKDKDTQIDKMTEKHHKKSLIDEKTATDAKRIIHANSYVRRLAGMQEFFADLTQLQGTHSKIAATISKAAAICQATITTYKMAITSYAYMTEWGGPIAGAIAAAAAIGAGISNIAKIRETSYLAPAMRTGGMMTVGGYGGTDSQFVQLRATPGEKIHVNTPAQARALEKSSTTQHNQRQFTQNLTMVIQGRIDKRTQDQLVREQRKAASREQDENYY